MITEEFIYSKEGIVLIVLITFFLLSVFIIAFGLFFRMNDGLSDMRLLDVAGFDISQRIFFRFLLVLHWSLPVLGSALLLIDLTGFIIYMLQPDKHTLIDILDYVINNGKK